MKKQEIRSAEGKLGILLVGLGAVSTTLIAGVEAVRKGFSTPVGSLTQLETIRLGKRTESRRPLIKDFVPLTDINDIVFGAWDIFPDNAFQAACNAGVLDTEILHKVSEELMSIQPMTAVFSKDYVSRLDGVNVKSGSNKMQLAEQIMTDITNFKEQNGCDRLVMVWAASTEKFLETSAIHLSLELFEKAMYDNDPDIAPSMIYAYAALKCKVPFANGAPNLTVDIPAMVELSKKEQVSICGKDFKTGQTLIKTILAPGLKARMLGLDGWYSTNILGNRDGEVLDAPENFKTKEESKLSVLDSIFQPSLYPDLYGDFSHVVRINYYPPRGDNKEGWDNIDIFGWLGYKMQIKINFLCRDSILAAPLVLDLALFMDLAQRAGRSGVQEWLSFYFKAPQVAPGLYPEHDLFIQKMKLKNTLRHMMGEDLIHHLGNEYYED